MLEQVPGAANVIEIRSGVELPARREEISFVTEDGLTLVGELAAPVVKQPVATLLTLHPPPLSLIHI